MSDTQMVVIKYPINTGMEACRKEVVEALKELKDYPYYTMDTIIQVFEEHRLVERDEILKDS